MYPESVFVFRHCFSGSEIVRLFPSAFHKKAPQLPYHIVFVFIARGLPLLPGGLFWTYKVLSGLALSDMSLCYKAPQRLPGSDTNMSILATVPGSGSLLFFPMGSYKIRFSVDLTMESFSASQICSGLTRLRKASAPVLTAKVFEVPYPSILNLRYTTFSNKAILLLIIALLYHILSSYIYFEAEDIFLTVLYTAIIFACLALSLLPR